MDNLARGQAGKGANESGPRVVGAGAVVVDALNFGPLANSALWQFGDRLTADRERVDEGDEV